MPWLGLLWMVLLETQTLAGDRRGNIACTAAAHRAGLLDLAQALLRCDREGRSYASIDNDRFKEALGTLCRISAIVLPIVPSIEADPLADLVLNDVLTNIIGCMIIWTPLNTPDESWKQRLREIMLEGTDPIAEVKVNYLVESIFLRLRIWLTRQIELGLLTSNGNTINVAPAARTIYLDAIAMLMQQD